MTWLTWYQVDPDFHPAQSVLQAEPATVPTTVRLAPVPRVAATAAAVEAAVRRLAPLQAGTIACVAGVAAGSGPGAGAGVGVAAGSAPGVGPGAGDGDQLDPPFEKRQAKYVRVVPGTVADPHPKRSYDASSEVRWGEELMKLRWASATV